MTLSERLSSATADQQRELMNETAIAIKGANGALWPAGVFTRMLDAEAYLDAAVMLLPDSWCIASLEWWPMCGINAGVTLREVRESDIGVGYDGTCGRASAHAATPALTLAAAALRARAAIQAASG